jgi:2-(1,2-epoxy-1,2-dihydrophenyl)acetyl-CoA isomerase
MEFRSLQLETKGSVAAIRLDRPEKLNALNEELARELIKAIELCEEDSIVRVVVLTGAGRAFCAGGDIQEMIRYSEETGDPSGFFCGPLRAIHEAALRITRTPKPVLASLRGFVSGAGFSLALCCDFRIAASGTKFNQAFVNIGLAPDTGATFILPKIIGVARAMELTCTGDFISSEQALDWGLVNRVVPDHSLENEVQTFAEMLAHKPTLAVAQTKKLIHGSYGRCLEDQFECERLAQVALSDSMDFREGIRAFVEKRTAAFKGE